jgi:hypothetical protein
MVRRVLVAGTMAVAAAVAAAAPTAAAASSPAVEAARQVSTDPAPTRAYEGAAVAVDPKDRQTIAVADADAYSSRCHLQLSRDGGLTWTERTSPQPAEYQQCVYSQMGPTVAVTFASDGTLYYAFAARRFPDWAMKVFVSRSADRGATWQTVQLTTGSGDPSRRDVGSYALPSVAVDPSDAERVYVAWQSNYNLWYHKEAIPADQQRYPDWPMRPLLAASDDGGRTFSAAVDLGADLPGGVQLDGTRPVNVPGTMLDLTAPHLVVGKGGEVSAFFGENTQNRQGQGTDNPHPDVHLFLAQSTDHGRRFHARPILTRPSGPSLGWLSDPIPAVNPRNGELYVVWEDMARTDPQGVLFMRSTDGGRTWSPTRRLSSFSPKWNTGWNVFLPGMAVSPNGRIDVAWYDFRNDRRAVDATDYDGAWFQDVYATSSRDGGRSWTTAAKINDRSIDRSVGVFEGTAHYDVRGPIGVASTNQMTLVAWDDSRNALADTQSQDIYLTRLRYGAVAPATTSRSPAAWATLGAAIALAVAGAALLIATTRTSPGVRPSRQPVPAPV